MLRDDPEPVDRKPPQSYGAFISQAPHLRNCWHFHVLHRFSSHFARISLWEVWRIKAVVLVLSSWGLFLQSRGWVNQVGGMTRQMIFPKILIWKSPSVYPQRSSWHFLMILLIYHRASWTRATCWHFLTHLDRAVAFFKENRLRFSLIPFLELFFWFSAETHVRL